MFTEVFIGSLPLFLAIFLGLCAGFAAPFRERVEPALTVFVFYIGLPALLFTLSSQADLSDGIPVSFILISVGSTIVFAVMQFGAMWALHRKSLGSMLTTSMAGSYGNVVYLGIPVVIGVLGEAGGLPAVIAQLVHNMIFLLGYPIVAAFALRDRGGRGNGRGKLGEALGNATYKSPLVWAVAVGLAVSIAQMPVPGVIMDFSDMMAASAAPVALFGVGLTLRSALRILGTGDSIIGPAVTAVAGKLLVMPVLTLGITLVFAPGLDDVWVVTLVLMAAMPTSASAYVLAQQGSGDARPTAIVILITNVFAVATLPLSVLILP